MALLLTSRQKCWKGRLFIIYIIRCGHGKAVDWYLLGVVMYEMLVGMPPYYANDREELFNNIQKAALKIPSYISLEGKNLLKAVDDIIV